MVCQKTYKLYTDGACSGNPGKMGIGCVIYDENDIIIHNISEELEIGTNNEAEYLAMIAGLKAIVKFNPEFVLVHSDSQLIVNQINGNWRIKKIHILLLYKQVIEILSKNSNINFSFKWIRRQYNQVADHLASSAIKQGRGVFIDNEFTEWNKIVNVGSTEEINSLPKTYDICANNIEKANKYNKNLRFRDFMNLKVGGRDVYSEFSERELFNIIKIRFGENVGNWLKKSLEISEEEFRKDVIRWTARGLYPNLAFKKASVNREISEKLKRKCIIS